MEGINKNKKKLKVLAGNSDAQASLEFVLVIPFIILIILAVSHLGLLVYQKNILEQAAREGARIVATTNSNSKAVSCIKEVCSDLEQQKLDIKIVPESSSSRKVGDTIEVVISYSYGGSMLKVFSGGNNLIKAKSNMRMECY